MAKHHTIPQFYLRGFIDSRGRSKSPYLWLGDLNTGHISRRAPKNVAAKSGFYDWEQVQTPKTLEQTHAEYESKLAPIVRRLREFDFILSNKERGRLAAFFGMMATRTPIFRTIATQVLIDDGLKQLEALAHDPEKVVQLIAERPPATSSLTTESLIDFIKSEAYTISPSQERVDGFAIELGLKYAEVMAMMRWTLLCAKGEFNFVMSDNPIAQLTRNAETPEIDFDTFSNPDLQFFVPVSPSVAILAHQRTFLPDGPMELSPTEAEAIQQRALPTFKDHVYASRLKDVEWVFRQLDSSRER